MLLGFMVLHHQVILEELCPGWHSLPKRSCFVSIEDLVTGVFPLLSHFRGEARTLFCYIEGCTHCFTTYFDTFGNVVCDLESTELTSTGIEFALLYVEFPLHVSVGGTYPSLDLFKVRRKVLSLNSYQYHCYVQ